MRKTEFIYTAILLPLDYIMLVCAGIVAYDLRKTGFIQNLDIVSDVFYQLPSKVYLTFVASMALLWVVFFAIVGLYDPNQTKKFINQITKVFLACTAGIATVIIFLFFKREFLFSSRFITLAAWGLSFLFVMTARSIIRIIRRVLLQYHIGAKRIILIGNDKNTRRFQMCIEKEPKWGYKIANKAVTIDQLKNKTQSERIDEVVLADLSYSKEKVNKFLQFCQNNHLDFKYAADIFSAHLHNIEMDAIASFPFIEIKRTPLEGWGRVKKRVLDLIGSAIGIILFFIPSVFISIAILVNSRGPILVKLERVGEHGKIFKLYKFRSMVKDAEKMKNELIQFNERKGPLFKMKHDPRITHIGKFLRRFSLDELPNFYNVLIGNMSLVGPRPHEPQEVAKYQEHEKKLLNIKPGITGIAQISGRSNLDFKEESRLDLYYVENWSLKTDIAILLKTPFSVFFLRSGAV